MTFPNFEDLEISTKTVIAMTNLVLDIDTLYEKLPISEYTVVQKRRGRKRKENKSDPNRDLTSGSIITIKYMGKIKGVDLSGKKKSGNNKFFRNALTVVMMVKDKLVNFKISKNGKFQITGCKNDEHTELCIKYIFGYMDGMYEITGEYPSVIFLTVMTNIGFNLGFKVNRKNLDEFINRHTPYNSLLETSFGYTGVNIKIPVARDIDFPIKTMKFIDESWQHTEMMYSLYLQNLSEKDQTKEATKQRYYTFLVFQSGNVIMSGMNRQIMGPIYQDFSDIVETCRGEITEVLSV